MTRPCTWPDGGCGELVEFLPTGRTKPDGKPVLHVVDAKPEKRIVQTLAVDPLILADQLSIEQGATATKSVWTWIDHHATCAKWLARVKRERAAKADAP